MIDRALLFVVAVFVVVVLPCAEARAQTTAGATITLGPQIERRSDRPSGVDNKTINYDDCKAGDSLGVAITVKNGTPSLEIWVGLSSSNCADATFRGNGGNSALCWKVGGLTAATNTKIDLKVRDLLAAEGETTGEALCDTLAADSTKGAGTLKVNFVLLTNGSDSGGTGTSLTVKFDLVGPAAPAGLDILAGDTRLFPGWTAATATSDTKGYYLYCEETASIDDCTAKLLIPGQHPPDDSSLKTGRTALTSTRGEVEGLTNYTPYACAVAGFDATNNIGVLSDLVCEIPQPVDGYFKAVRGAGGTAGGGYCSFGRSAATPATAALALAALGGLFVRRRRRQR